MLLWGQRRQAHLVVVASADALPRTRRPTAGSSSDCAGGDSPHGVEEVVAADLLEHVARCPGDDRVEQRLVVVVGREHQAGDVRVRRPDLAAHLDAGSVGEPDVEQGDIGRRRGIRARPSAAEPASPTTSISPSVSSSSRTPRRTISWSSRTNTRMVTRPSWSCGRRGGRSQSDDPSCHQVGISTALREIGTFAPTVRAARCRIMTLRGTQEIRFGGLRAPGPVHHVGEGAVRRTRARPRARSVRAACRQLLTCRQKSTLGGGSTGEPRGREEAAADGRVRTSAPTSRSHQASSGAATRTTS